MNWMKALYQEFYYSQYILMDSYAKRSGGKNIWTTWTVFTGLRGLNFLTIALILQDKNIPISPYFTPLIVVFLIADYFWILEKKERNKMEKKANELLKPNKAMRTFTICYMIFSLFSVFIYLRYR